MLYYKVQALLIAEHKYSLEGINDMYPYERDLHIMFLNEHVSAKNEAKKSSNGPGPGFATTGTIADIDE